MADAVVRGVRLHYQRIGVVPCEGSGHQGSGSPRVVFVHGLVMDNLASWYFSVASAVAAFADVLLFDLRGHGLSERPQRGYGVDDFVLDLDALVDATLGDGPIVLVGNSVGALIATRFALKFPMKTAGLVLVDGHLGDGDFGERMKATLSLTGAGADRAIADTFKDWLGRHSERKRNRLAQHARALVHETTLVDDLRATPPITEAELATITAPTLALFGEDSDLRARGERLVGAMPNATIEVFPGCTHSILWEATALVRDRIVSFCNGRARPEK
jgi:pimeloyl-ACP methyl ester carboxylesterase